MPLKIKFKVFFIIVIYLAVLFCVQSFFGLIASFVYSALGVYFLYRIYPQFDIHSDIRFDNTKKQVCLTFDDGPTQEFTESILKILKDKNVTASFFVIGIKAKTNLDIIKRTILQGCEVGAHTVNHKKLHNYSYSKIAAEIEPVIKDIQQVYSEIGKPKDFKKIFRAPHGFKNISLKIFLASNCIKLIPWTRGVWDTDAPGSDEILKRATVKPKRNEILLLHDGLGLNDASEQQKKGILEALPRIIDFYKTNGYVFVKASSYLRDDRR